MTANVDSPRGEAEYVVGTAGHIDHGKSTLVTALTGIDPDRLVEEKRRGMTIDLGFAHMRLPSGRETDLYIMLVEILPNCRGPLIADFCLRLGYTTIAIGTLGFLGLGLSPPDPDWGGMVKQATSVLTVYPDMALFPCFAIVSLVLGFNLLGDGLRDLSQAD